MPESNSNDTSQTAFALSGATADFLQQLKADRNSAFQSRGNAGSASGSDTEAKVFSTFTETGQFLPGVPNYSLIDPSQIPPPVNGNDFNLAIGPGLPRANTNIVEGPYNFWQTNTGFALVKSATAVAGLSNESGVSRLRAQQAKAQRSKPVPRFISQLWP